MSTQQRIIAGLFAFAILLLVANILVGKVFKTENKIITPSPLSSVEIDSLFFKAISNFGLQPSIVRKQAIKEIKLKDDYPSYSINLPKDLPIPVFISELNDLFNGFEADIVTEEKKISGRTLVRIISEEEIRLAASIDYNPNQIRESPSAAFLITINDKTQKAVVDNLLNTPEPFGFIFTPSLVMKSFIAKNHQANRQFALLLGDETSDLDFKLESNYSERRLKSSIRYILAAFSNAAFFVIDDNSSFYNSKIYSFVEKEFLSRKIKLRKKSELNFISGSLTNVSSQFSELLENLDNRNSAIIVCSPDDFTSLLDDIRSFRKIGYKYVVPSEMLTIN